VLSSAKSSYQIKICCPIRSGPESCLAMKSLVQIFGALGTAFLCPRGGPSPETHVVWIILFLIGRFVLAAWLVPAVLISGMVSDSGTDVAVKGAMALMYAMSLLIWAALLWSWRCAAASVCLVVSLFLLFSIFDGNDKISGLLTPVLVVVCLGITEALPAPIRTTWRFLVWCSIDGDQVSDDIISDKEMAPLPQVL
jgi:hypothetical protein